MEEYDVSFQNLNLGVLRKFDILIFSNDVINSKVFSDFSYRIPYFVFYSNNIGTDNNSTITRADRVDLNLDNSDEIEVNTNISNNGEKNTSNSNLNLNRSENKSIVGEYLIDGPKMSQEIILEKIIAITKLP